MGIHVFLVAAVGVVAVVGGRVLARLTRRPAAAFLVVVGAVASVIPGIPSVRLDPQVVFLVFLPPLVYRAGFVTSPRELREHGTAIGLSALGLVLATTFAVAALARLAVPELGWPAAVVLGACVAPTDPVSATTVLSRLGVSQDIVTILEGEGLVNDGIALTLFGVGVSALAQPTNPLTGLGDFAKVAVGGAAFGLAVGFVMARLRRPWHDARIDLVLSVAIPYAAYVGADAAGLSGILAAVVAGLYIGQAATTGREPALRIQAEGFWDNATFLLEAWLFVLLGLQFRAVAASVAQYPWPEVAGLAAAVVGAVVVIRMLWQLIIPSIRWRPEGRLVDTGGFRMGERVVLGWSGLRGAISLAAALSIPLTVAGRTFPGRPLVLFATFCVIVVTLLGQGATLPWVISRAHAEAPEEERGQLSVARRCSLEAAKRRLDELAGEVEVPDETMELLSRSYDQRLRRATEDREDHEAARTRTSGTLQAELMTARRQALEDLYGRGKIGYRVLREALRDLDYEFESVRRR